MAKKKREICPYCGKSFAYLSRHKCKIKERVEGEIDETSDVERRFKRIQEKKKDFTRGLKKDEVMTLNIINREKDIYFDELLQIIGKDRDDLDEILDVLSLQSRIKLKRELMTSSWTKHIFSIDDYEQEVPDIKEIDIKLEEKDGIWNSFSKVPCFVCPFLDKCNDTNLDNDFNPHNCPFLTDWIEKSLEGERYDINFDEIKKKHKN